MFVQVIEGSIGDIGVLRRQLDDWGTNLRPGATGFLGSTAGVAADGSGIVIVRFASPEAARANSDRPQQGAWWAATQHAFKGSVGFRDTTDVETMFAFGDACASAGFVQVVQARVTDRSRLASVEDASLDAMKASRPSLIGALRVWDGDDFVQAAYFTNEAEARRDEAAGVPEAVAGAFAEWQRLCEGLRFLDLSDPWLM